MDFEEISNLAVPVTEAINEQKIDSNFEDLPPITVSFSPRETEYRDSLIPVKEGRDIQ